LWGHEHPYEPRLAFRQKRGPGGSFLNKINGRRRATACEMIHLPPVLPLDNFLVPFRDSLPPRQPAAILTQTLFNPELTYAQTRPTIV
jgi:hypothetical protein